MEYKYVPYYNARNLYDLCKEYLRVHPILSFVFKIKVHKDAYCNKYYEGSGVPPKKLVNGYFVPRITNIPLATVFFSLYFFTAYLANAFVISPFISFYVLCFLFFLYQFYLYLYFSFPIVTSEETSRHFIGQKTALCVVFFVLAACCYNVYGLSKEYTRFQKKYNTYEKYSSEAELELFKHHMNNEKF